MVARTNMQRPPPWHSECVWPAYLSVLSVFSHMRRHGTCVGDELRGAVVLGLGHLFPGLHGGGFARSAILPTSYATTHGLGASQPTRQCGQNSLTIGRGWIKTASSLRFDSRKPLRADLTPSQDASVRGRDAGIGDACATFPCTDWASTFSTD